MICSAFYIICGAFIIIHGTFVIICSAFVFICGAFVVVCSGFVIIWSKFYIICGALFVIIMRGAFVVICGAFFIMRWWFSGVWVRAFEKSTMQYRHIRSVWNTDCGLRTGHKHSKSGIKYGLRGKVLHWINKHFFKSKLPVIIEVSFKRILNSSFPESARSYRFNHTRLPKKQKEDTEGHKIDEVYEFSNDPSRY